MNIDPTALIIFLIVGAVAGWLAGQIMKGSGFGLVGDIIVGIGDYSGRYPRTGKSFVSRVVHVWRLDGQKIRGFEQFTDTLLVANAMR